MFSVDPQTGNKVDEHLHDLKISKDADAKHRNEARQRAARLHRLTDEELDVAYGRDSR